MAKNITCQYASCLNVVGEKGVTVTLKSPDYYDNSRGVYCCAAHAAAALLRLAFNRHESPVETPSRWKIR
jgi:hypothetical protein